MKITANEKQFILRKRATANSLAKAELLTILNNIDLVIEDLKTFKTTHIRDKKVDKAVKQMKSAATTIESLREDL